MNTKALTALSSGAKLCLVIVVLLPLGCSHISSSQAEAPRITKEEVVPILGRARRDHCGCPVGPELEGE